MNKTTKGLITVAAVLAVAGIAWYISSKGKLQYAKTIVKFNGSSQPLAWLITLDEGYLRSWAKSLVKGKEEFPYNGKLYNTKGGKLK